MQHLAADVDSSAVPETLRAAIEARLATLDPGTLEALEAAAVAGHEFTAAAVSAALGAPAGALTTPGIVEPHGTVEWPDGTTTEAFAFTHALHRDVLLALLDPGHRAELHRRVGERLEAAFGTDPEAAHEIAAHYVAGRRPAPAVRFLRLAAGNCRARRAYREAIAHLERALAATEDLPDGPPRQRERTELLSELGQAYVAIDGWSSPQALDYLERARATAEALGDREPLASVLLALATLHEVRGEPAPALDMIGIGEEIGELGVDGAELMACALFHQGAFTRALEHADRGVAAFEAESDAGHYDTFPATLGDNAGIGCHDWAALSLWFLGRPAEALRRARHAVALSEQPSRAYSTATACAQLAAVHACRHEPEEALRWAQATVDAARDRGYDYRVAMGRVLRGWAHAAGGRANGVDEIVCGLQASRATGAHLEDPFYLGLLADAHLRAGDPDAGLEAVGEALAIATRERAHYYDGELHRVRGELLLARGDAPALAEAAIRDALAVARQQGARALELRAALALARGFPGPGTRALLASVHETLADEDTPDGRAAVALLGGSAGEVQRRRITVLAWEIAGLGELADRLEPERLAALLRACHAEARAAALRERGHVGTEDEAGGLLYFGYPRALEDGPRRAIRTGRALAEALRTALPGVPVELCAGVDTGPAVVAPVGGTPLAMGQTPRTAWRLAAAAPAGAVLVSDATRALSGGEFSFTAHGPGFVATGEAARGDELTPLVGRELELELLAGRWEQAEHGLGQAVVLMGEPGIGKTRLVRELAGPARSPGARAAVRGRVQRERPVPRGRALPARAGHPSRRDRGAARGHRRAGRRGHARGRRPARRQLRPRARRAQARHRRRRPELRARARRAAAGAGRGRGPALGRPVDARVARRAAGRDRRGARPARRHHPVAGPAARAQPRQPARARPVHAHRGRDAGGARGPVAGGRGARGDRARRRRPAVHRGARARRRGR